jgi:NitT/TauT family transport system substrate-binding protein
MTRFPIGALSFVLALALSGCAAPQPPASKPSPPAPAGGATSAPAAVAKPAAPAPRAPAPAAAPAAPAAGQAARQALSPRVQVRYGQLGSASDAGVYLAIERGYFAEEGLELEMVPIDSGGRMVPSLASGQLEVGGGGISVALINAVSRDVPLRLIADKGSLRPGFGFESLVVRKELADSGAVRGVADLRGRRVAVNTRTSVDMYALGTALEGAGLGVGDVTVEEVVFPDMIAALANGSIDAATPIEPSATAIVSRGIGTRLLTMDQVIPNGQLATIMYAPQFWREQPEAGRRFALAYLRGVRDYNRAFTAGEGRADAIQILTQYTPIKDPAVFDQMVLPGLNPNGHINVQSVQAAQEFWHKVDLLQNVLPAEQLVDHSYVDWALGVLGRWPE